MIKKILQSLRNVVRYRELVNSLSINKVRRSINSQLSQISTDLSTNDYDIKNLKERITTKHLKILKILEDIDYDLNTFKQGINKTVDDLAIPYYQKSKDLCEKRLSIPAEDKRRYLRDKELTHNAEARELLITSIGGYVSNQYACCQISPGYGDITKHILSGTPLYIADEDHILLRQFREDFFNPQMQRRTNWYTISDNDDDPLSKLPQEQIGCFIVIDYLNFKTVDIIKKYLQSIYQCLRPGGTAVFTFNNCDYPKAIDKVDEMYYCYTTGTEMKTVCTAVGFEIIKLVALGYDELDNGISWLEIKKPGVLTTIRNSQGLAELKNL
tara:strand:- start:252 stop:1232 length:981 start_codon:yes stop_codon:yes gene_type:complete